MKQEWQERVLKVENDIEETYCIEFLKDLYHKGFSYRQTFFKVDGKDYMLIEWE